MKCPYCGRVVKPGTLFCPKCLTEIPWVPEYNTVETLITQKRQEEKKRERQSQRQEQQLNRIRRKRRKRFFLCLSVFLLVLLAVVAAVWWYLQVNSYAYQYRSGVRAYEDGDYEAATDHIDYALSLEPDNPNANLMMARIFDAQKDYLSVEKILTVFLKDHPDNQEAYGVLLSAMEKNGDLEGIKELMQACANEDILETFSDYVCPKPTIKQKSGTYGKKSMSISIAGDCEKIYYTLDGTKPDESSRVYTAPIRIEKGITVLYAYGVNEKGIPSDVIYRKYILNPETDP